MESVVGLSPQLMGLACIELGDVLVERIWHGGFPHLPHRSSCPYLGYRNQGVLSPDARVLIDWRRNVAFGLAGGAQVWKIPQPDRVFRELLRFGRQWGPIDKDVVIERVRTYLVDVAAMVAGA